MRNKKIPFWVVGLGAALCIGGVFSLFSSSSPDGLSRVAINNGFADQTIIRGILPNYFIPGIKPLWLSKGLTGFLGTAFVFLIIGGLGWLMNRTKKPLK